MGLIPDFAMGHLEQIIYTLYALVLSSEKWNLIIMHLCHIESLRSKLIILKYVPKYYSD